MANLAQVYLNGEFLPPDQARVSVFDRGFIFGDGVYEVIPVFGGRLFRLPHHLSRLDASLGAIRLRNPHTQQEWNSIFTRLLAAGSGDQSIYLQITRGVAPRDHAFPPNITPTVFAYAQPLKYSPPEQLAQGVAAVTAADIRWQRCDIKAIALLANALLRQEAIGQGAVEAILVRDGLVTEGAASNIFVVKNGRLVTTSADEVWLTSSTKEILPITRIDGRPVGNGKPGPMHAKMFALYKEYKQAFIQGQVD
jgi:D-alanine transaminase